MVEIRILGIFAFFLILSLLCRISLLWALLAGFILFFFLWNISASLVS